MFSLAVFLFAGIVTGANGDKYVGEWKDDKRHGQGMSCVRDDRSSVTGPDAFSGRLFVRRYPHRGRGRHVRRRMERRQDARSRYVVRVAMDGLRCLLVLSFLSLFFFVWVFLLLRLLCRDVGGMGCMRDEADGAGTFKFLDGAKYVGDWQDGMFHGQGMSCARGYGS